MLTELFLAAKIIKIFIFNKSSVKILHSWEVDLNQNCWFNEEDWFGKIDIWNIYVNLCKIWRMILEYVI